MKLQELTLIMVRTAIDAYLELAYGGSAGSRERPDAGVADSDAERSPVELFQHEVIRSGEGKSGEGKSGEGGRATTLSRYTLRLGNRNYPFMKLLLQEHIVPGEFYFAVDTHDDLDIKPDYPDYEAWVAVRKFNSELKRKIEARFAEVGLTTAANIRQLCAERRAVAAGRPITERATVLVVDDEEDLAHAVASLLEAKGFVVHEAHDGREGLAVARRIRPDMVLLDYEMPEMDGLEVIRALREDPSTAAIPVLLCTASKVAVAEVRKADAFLAKPFEEELLYEMVQRVLTAGRQEAPR